MKYMGKQGVSIAKSNRGRTGLQRGEVLTKCVDSILAQTEPDFELLLVDDGSTDGSGGLCDKLAERDGRIRVIHQETRAWAAPGTRASKRRRRLAPAGGQRRLD